MLQPNKIFIFFLSGIITSYIIVFLFFINHSAGEDYHDIAGSGTIQYNTPGERKVNNKNVFIIYDKLCNKYSKLCHTLKYEGQYTEETELTFSILTLYFIKTIDTIIGDNKVSNTIKNITISSEKSTRRGYSTHTAIFLHTSEISYKEYIMVLVHELGHIIDLGTIEGNSNKKNPLFTEFNKKEFSIDDRSIKYYSISRENENQRKTTQMKDSFCSIYGMSNPFEDFAECFHLYINYNNYFRIIMSENESLRKKYTFIEELMHGKYLYKKIGNISKEEDISYRYWDTTRMN